MSDMTDKLITWVIKTHEGGFVFTDRVDDLGGPTYAGVSFKWFHKWYCQKYANEANFNFGIAKEHFIETAQLDDNDHLKKLIYEFYKDEFINRAHITKLPIPLHKLMISSAVNIDPRDASKLLQKALNANDFLTHNHKSTFILKVDGIIGTKTLAVLQNSLISAEQVRIFINTFCFEWIQHYVQLVEQIPSQRVNLGGWINRVWYFVK